jgi:hypothetical protein
MMGWKVFVVAFVLCHITEATLYVSNGNGQFCKNMRRKWNVLPKWGKVMIFPACVAWPKVTGTWNAVWGYVYSK